MAGAGDEKESENPFSFKSFLKRGDGPINEVTKTTSKSTSRKKKTATKKVSVSRESDVVIGARKASDDENPFSFVKFVERKSTKPTGHPAQLTSSSGDEESSLTIVNPVSSFTPLPPQNNHSKTKAKPGKATASSATKSSSTQRSKAPKNSSKLTKPKKEVQKELTIFDVSDGSDSDAAHDPPLFSDPIPTVPAPDIFGSKQKTTSSSSSENSPESSRTALSLGLGDEIFLDNMTNHSAQVPFDDTSELRKLRAENERLQKELTRYEDSLKTEKEKNSTLRSQINALKVKEAEDTKALEDMVQLVESNLVTTTKRAVAAEGTIKKLKQEITSLQVQLSHSTPQHYEELLRGVREKSSYASQQLASAAQMADRNIRELVSGVEALKNVAEILQFIDNISELRTQDDKKAS